VFSPEQLEALLKLGRHGAQQLIAAQRAILGIELEGACTI